MHIKNIIFSASMFSIFFLHLFAAADNNNKSSIVKDIRKTGAALAIMGTGTYVVAIGGCAVGGTVGFFTNLYPGGDLGRGMVLGGLVGMAAGGLLGFAGSSVLAEKIVDGEQNDDADEKKKEELKEDLSNI